MEKGLFIKKICKICFSCTTENKLECSTWTNNEISIKKLFSVLLLDLGKRLNDEKQALYISRSNINCQVFTKKTALAKKKKCFCYSSTYTY